MQTDDHNSDGVSNASLLNTGGDTSPTAAPTIALQFVQMTDTGKMDAQSRKLVRAHVMKDYDKRLTAIRKRSVGTEESTVIQAAQGSTTRKKAYDGMYKWRPGKVEAVTVARDKGNGRSRRTPSSSSMAKSPYPLSSDDRSSRQSSRSMSSRASLENTSRDAVCTDVQTVNEYEAIYRADKDPPGFIPVECRFETVVSLMTLLSPPVHKLGVGNGRIDPFNTLPVPSARIEVLVTHFHSRIMASSLMMSARKHWFILATGDRALFLIAMSHAAGNLSLQQQKHTWDAPEALLLRTEAIRVINERILDVDTKGPSDGTIGAVASMASYEGTNGTPLSIRTHMSGLAQMITMRGGLVDGISDMALLRLILWADLNTANALNTKPLFDFPPTFLSTSYLSDPLPLFIIDGRNAQIEDTAPLMLLPGPLAFALLDLRHLVKVLNFPKGNGAAVLERLDDLRLSDKVYIVQRKLMDLTSEYNIQSLDKKGQDSLKNTSLIAGPAAMASLIFVECILREIAPTARIIGTLLFRLATAITHTESLLREQTPRGSSPFQISCQKHGILRVKLWIFAVGGTVAQKGGDEVGERGWWVRRLRVVAEELFSGSNADVDIDAALKSVVWPEEEGSSTRWMMRWKGIWQDVIAEFGNVK